MVWAMTAPNSNQFETNMHYMLTLIKIAKAAISRLPPLNMMSFMQSPMKRSNGAMQCRACCSISPVVVKPFNTTPMLCSLGGAPDTLRIPRIRVVKHVRHADATVEKPSKPIRDSNTITIVVIHHLLDAKISVIS